MTFDRFDTVVVPFPFTDRRTIKRRPAVMLSDRAFGEDTGNAVLAMITSAEQSHWAGDIALSDRDGAGLPKPCKVRMKLFTLEQRLIEKRIGTLSPRDRDEVARVLRATFGL